MNKLKLIFVAVFGIVIPGVLLSYAYTMWRLLTPLFEVPLSQLLEELILLKTGEIIMLILGIITLPGAIIISISFIIGALRIWLD